MTLASTLEAKANGGIAATDCDRPWGVITSRNVSMSLLKKHRAARAVARSARSKVCRQTHQQIGSPMKKRGFSQSVSIDDAAFWFGESDTYVNYSGSITSATQSSSSDQGSSNDIAWRATSAPPAAKAPRGNQGWWGEPLSMLGGGCGCSLCAPSAGFQSSGADELAYNGAGSTVTANSSSSNPLANGLLANNHWNSPITYSNPDAAGDYGAYNNDGTATVSVPRMRASPSLARYRSGRRISP